ncbi:hypothetical protein MNV49_004714 [Pseudohyphozyma bogoriensis]|nr:hypothetical protein MNV49_004714 [Pseudohyphozyma bogoriensis]
MSSTITTRRRAALTSGQRSVYEKSRSPSAASSHSSGSSHISIAVVAPSEAASPPKIKQGRGYLWTAEEDEILVTEVGEFSYHWQVDWQDVADKVGDRTALACRVRWRKLKGMEEMECKSENVASETGEEFSFPKRTPSLPTSSHSPAETPARPLYRSDFDSRRFQYRPYDRSSSPHALYHESSSPNYTGRYQHDYSGFSPSRNCYKERFSTSSSPPPTLSRLHFPQASAQPREHERYRRAEADYWNDREHAQESHDASGSGTRRAECGQKSQLSLQDLQDEELALRTQIYEKRYSGKEERTALEARVKENKAMRLKMLQSLQGF